MAINVRIYAHAGLSTPPVRGTGGRYTSDSLFLLKQPPMAGEVLSVSTGSSTASSADLSPNGCTILHVQVAPGGRAHYAIDATGGTPSATTSSPIIEGSTQIEWGTGWKIAFREAATDA